MSEPLTIITQPIGHVGGTRPRPGVTRGGAGQFDQLLQQARQQAPIKFSGHALSRMEARGINFNQHQLDRLQQAVAQVDARGGRDSLVMLDETALVVSIKNETVVTLVDREQMKNNVFTNIDSAVIA